jgi:sulfur carrier protein
VSDPTPTASLRLSVNGTPHDVPPGTSVRNLLALLGFAGRRVAVAVNRDVVPRSSFETRPLAAGDRVEILEAVGGG